MIYILASTNPLDHIIGVLIFLVSNIYHIAAWAFEVFLVLSTGQILDSEKYSLIIQNFYIVLGVVLLFFLSFSLLKGIVDPDDNKQGGSVIKTSIINLVTSVIMLALLPTIFGFLYDFQTSFITKYNVIGRFFGYGNLGTPTSTKDTDYICQMDNESIKQGAFQITNGVFTAFFNVNSEKCSTKVNSLESLKNCKNDVTPKDDILFITWSSSRPSFYETVGRVDRNGFFSSYIDFSTNVREGDISFNFILSLIAGLLLIYVGISYSLDMALRMVKLVFYQIIAPIPIFARVVPDGPLKGSFEKWLKIVLACYLEVYIRILSFYFVVYLCVAMLDSSYIGNIFLCFNPVVGLLTRAFLLMGMVMFMKQAPKLIGDATGLDTGNMKLGIREKLKDGGFFAAGAAVGSSITAGVRNFTNARKNGESKWKAFGSAIGGGAAGIYHGGKAGWSAGSWSDMKSAAGKGAQAVISARDKRAAYKASHPGKYGVIKGKIDDTKDTIQRWAGLNNIQELQEYNQMISNVTGKVDKVKDTAKKMITDSAAKGKKYTFGVTGSNNGASFVDAKGNKISMSAMKYDLQNVKNMNDLIQRATNSGKAVKVVNDNGIVRMARAGESGSLYTADQLNRIYGTFENDYAKALSDRLLQSKTNYDSMINGLDPNGDPYDIAEKALLEQGRAAAEDARFEVKRVLSSGLVGEANANAASGTIALNASTIEGDLHITDDSAFAKLGDVGKYIQSQNNIEIAKIQQKDREKEGK